MAWEYKSVNLLATSNDDLGMLAQAGRDGWELVSVAVGGIRDQLHVCYLKRKKREESKLRSVGQEP